MKKSVEPYIRDAIKIDYLADDADEYTQIENVQRAKRILGMYSEGENSFSDDLKDGNREYCLKHIRQLKGYIAKYRKASE